jgi:hypothetical protein
VRLPVAPTSAARVEPFFVKSFSEVSFSNVG